MALECRPEEAERLTAHVQQYQNPNSRLGKRTPLWKVHHVRELIAEGESTNKITKKAKVGGNTVRSVRKGLMMVGVL